jgi:hypothetical protein
VKEPQCNAAVRPKFRAVSNHLIPINRLAPWSEPSKSAGTLRQVADHEGHDAVVERLRAVSRRARSHRRVAPLLVRFIPDSPRGSVARCSVSLFLRGQRDRTLLGGRGAAAGGGGRGAPARRGGGRCG